MMIVLDWTHTSAMNGGVLPSPLTTLPSRKTVIIVQGERFWWWMFLHKPARSLQVCKKSDVFNSSKYHSKHSFERDFEIFQNSLN